MTVPSLLIVGSGGHGRSVAEAVELAGTFKIAGFADAAWPDVGSVYGYPVLGSTKDLSVFRQSASAAVVAVGDNEARAAMIALVRSAGFMLATVVHPAAIISPRTIIGAGSTIMAGAIVGTEVTLGVGTIVNCGAVIDHHCRIEDYGHLGVGACMAGGAFLGRAAWVKAGAIVGPKAKVAEGRVSAPGEVIEE